MDRELWTAVDRYLKEYLTPPDPALENALQTSARAAFPAIQVTPTQGKLLYVLAKSIQARSILEIGTLGGYSTIWLARALQPGGRLISLEADPEHARVARGNLEVAGLSAQVEIRLGKGLESLPKLAEETSEPFDLVFIDADKVNTTAYFEWAVKLTRPGGLILVDNVIRQGKLIDAASDDPNVLGMRRFLEHLGREKRVSATVVQTVGEKDYDGFAIAVVS